MLIFVDFFSRYIGYNLPANEYLKQSLNGTEFIFEYPLAHTISEAISDEYIVTIVLPEGSEIISVEISQNLHQTITKNETSFRYLDFVGRPTVKIVVPKHIPGLSGDAVISVRYSFEKHLMLVEPLYLTCGIFGLFVLSIVLSRLQLDFKQKGD